MMCANKVEHTPVDPPADTGVEAIGIVEKLDRSIGVDGDVIPGRNDLVGLQFALGWAALLVVVVFLVVGATRTAGPQTQEDRVDDLTQRQFDLGQYKDRYVRRRIAKRLRACKVADIATMVQNVVGEDEVKKLLA